MDKNILKKQDNTYKQDYLHNRRRFTNNTHCEIISRYAQNDKTKGIAYIHGHSPCTIIYPFTHSRSLIPL